MTAKLCKSITSTLQRCQVIENDFQASLGHLEDLFFSSFKMASSSHKVVALFFLVFMLTMSATRAEAKRKGQDAAGSKPHLVFVYVDDWGYADVGFRNPNILTPNFDKMESEGVLLDRHYVFKYCSPSRASFLTGRWPHHAHQWNIKQNVLLGLNLNFTTLPNKLKSVGYSTHMIGKWHLGFYRPEYLPINRGFDTASGFLGGGENHMTQVCGAPTNCAVDFWKNRAPDPRNGSYDAYSYRDDLHSILEDHNPDEPFFLYLPLHNVHGPFQAPQEWLNMYEKQDTCAFRKTYQAMVSVADNVTGTLIDLLKKKGMWENTLMVVSADNGGAKCAGSNYPLRGHKGTLFEGGVRASAFADGGMIPSNMRGKKVFGAIHAADWYPTFCYLAGVDSNDTGPGRFPVDGHNVWPLLTGKANKTDHVDIVLSFNYTLQHEGAIIMDPYKLIIGSQAGPSDCPGTWWTTLDSPCHNGTNGPDCDPYCLYNLDEDPHERHNLASSMPEKLQELLDRYNSYGKEPRHMQDQGYSNGTLPTNKKACEFMAEHGGYWQPWEETQLY